MSAASLGAAAVLAEPTQPVVISVPSTCVCRFCVDCLTVFTGSICSCGGVSIPEVKCYGCTEDACEYVGVIAAQWFAANPTDSPSGWTISGIDTPLREGDPLFRIMGGHGEQQWRIEPWAGGSMEVTLMENDVPVSAPMRVRP